MSEAKDLRRKRHAMHIRHKAERLAMQIAQLQQQLSETQDELHRVDPNPEFTFVGDDLPIAWTPADEAALYSERPIFNTAKEPSMNDLSKTALEQTLRISKEDAHGIKQALLSSASGASTLAASYPEDAAKGLAKAFVFLDEISRPVGE